MLGYHQVGFHFTIFSTSYQWYSRINDTKLSYFKSYFLKLANLITECTTPSRKTTSKLFLIFVHLITAKQDNRSWAQYPVCVSFPVPGKMLAKSGARLACQLNYYMLSQTMQCRMHACKKKPTHCLQYQLHCKFLQVIRLGLLHSSRN